MKRTTLSTCGLALALASTAVAQNERDLQITSVNFVDETLEIQNLGTSTFDLTRWRLCSHDSDEGFVYSGLNALNGLSLGPGDALTIHYRSDAPAGTPNALNLGNVGPLATPLDRDAYSIALFFPDAAGNIFFGNSALMADHVQWNDGGPAGAAELRSAQAVSVGLWTGTGEFVSVESSTNRIELVDRSGSSLHGPGAYFAIASSPFDEAADGDLSGDHLAPSALTLPLGTATLAAEQQGDLFGRDIDYVTITVPAGQQLASLHIDGYFAEPGNQAFIGIQEGTVFTTDASSTGVGDLFGGVVYGEQNVDQDILPGLGMLGSGFTPPLPAGDYTFWFNQTGPNSEVVLRFETESLLIGSSFCGPAAPNSLGRSGRLEASGSDLALDNDVTLRAFDLPPNQIGFAIVSRTQDFVTAPGGSAGNLCLGGSIGRYTLQVGSSGADGQIFTDVDLTGIPQGSGSATAAAGDTWSFQVWHRDVVAGSSTSNFTEGLALTFQ